MAKLKPTSKSKDATFDPDRGPVFSIRFALALVLMVLGIAWIAYSYIGVRPEGGYEFPIGEPSGPGFMQDLEGWNYLVGFGAFFLGLIISAHPSTPLGRGRGVVVGMLGCFVLGLAWICVFYAIAQDTSSVPIFNDLDQKNLVVGIAFMAVGFTFATRWE
ncbi:MAG: cell division protein CrgA [Nocardioides sp.]